MGAEGNPVSALISYDLLLSLDCSDLYLPVPCPLGDLYSSCTIEKPFHCYSQEATCCQSCLPYRTNVTGAAAFLSPFLYLIFVVQGVNMATEPRGALTYLLPNATRMMIYVANTATGLLSMPQVSHISMSDSKVRSE
jgi:hypothetical protein